MSDLYLGPCVTITPFHKDSLAAMLGSTLGSGAYPTLNLAYYYPFILYQPIVVVKLFCYNGSIASGNIDLGIYDKGGTRIQSAGSTAQSGTSAIQSFDITDVLIGPGLFYLAVAMDNITGTLWRASIGQAGRLMGIFQQSSAFALPSTATFAATSGNLYLPMIGLTTRALV